MNKEDILEKLKNKDGRFIFYVNIDPKYNSLADYEMFYQSKILSENGYNSFVLLDDEEEVKKIQNYKKEKGELIENGLASDNPRFIELNNKISQLENPYPNWFDDSLKVVKVVKLSTITKDFKVSPSDFIIMGELFSNVAFQLNKLPSKNIIYLHNYNAFITSQTNDLSYKYDLGIDTFIYTNDYSKKFIEDNYQADATNLNFEKITPTIPKFFVKENSYKKPKVGIISRNSEDIKKIHKIFMKRYPTLNFISFEVIGGMRRDLYAEKINEFAVLVEVDKLKTFGTVILEGIASNCFVVSHLSELPIDYVEDSESIPISLVNKVVGVKDSKDKFNDIVQSIYQSLLMHLQNYDIKTDSNNYIENNKELFESRESASKIINGYDNLLQQRIKEIETIQIKKEEENEA